jgi:hypothetical protein
MLKPIDLSHSQEYLKKEMEKKIDENQDHMEKKIDENQDHMEKKIDENQDHMEKKMLDLQNSMSFMMLHALDERIPIGDIKMKGNRENVEE